MPAGDPNMCRILGPGEEPNKSQTELFPNIGGRGARAVRGATAQRGRRVALERGEGGGLGPGIAVLLGMGRGESGSPAVDYAPLQTP